MGFGFSLYENVKGFTGSGLQNRIASNMIRVPKHCATQSPLQINSTTPLLLFEKKKIIHTPVASNSSGDQELCCSSNASIYSPSSS